MKLFILINILLSLLLANSDVKTFQFAGVETIYKDKEIYIKRLKNPNCRKVAITPKNIFGGNLAAPSVPNECKKSFVTTVGVIQPIQIDNEIQTVGEIEVLKFLEYLEYEPEKYILVDSRRAKWYKEITIPHATNIPFSDIVYDEDFEEEYANALKQLNINKRANGELDFSQVKSAIVFCNGNWCVQSVWAIEALVKIGYPKDKIFWYRGGLQDWLGSGFTTVKP